MAQSQSTGYEYSALQQSEIRLIRLRPGTLNGDLCFELVHHTLQTTEDLFEAGESEQRPATKVPKGWRALQTPEGRPFYERLETQSTSWFTTYRHPDHGDELWNPSNVDPSRTYEALSYTWGDASHREIAIVLDEQEKEKTLSIGRNLGAALRHLRLPDAVRTLWVDAVCINQDDLDERAAQVKRMRHIYHMASSVIVWLGERSEDSSRALRTLEYLSRQVEVSTSARVFSAFDPVASEPSWIDTQVVLPYSAADWRAIEHLFQRPWFERLWVLQEVSANSNTAVQCGQDSMSWCFLRRAIIALDGRVGVPADLSYRLNNKVAIAYGMRISLRHNLFVARQHLCQDPRDKIYGVLGLIAPRLQAQIVPSYEVSCFELYKRIFLLHSERTGRLDLLTQCFVNEELPSSMSWVPDWRSFPYAFRVPEPGYQASGASRAEFRVVSGSRLEVTGVLHDSIVFVPHSSDVRVENLIGFVRAIRPPELQGSTYVTGEPLQKAWIRTLGIDLFEERFPGQSNPEYASWEQTVLAILGEHPNDQALANMRDLSNSVRDTFTDMRFFRTQQGYFGFGPFETKPGDRVCVLLGVPTPLIIRPSDDEQYQVIGWAYVHGLMDSESFLGPLTEGWIVIQHYDQSRQLPRYVDVPRDWWQLEDPRLGDIPKGWRRVLGRELTQDDPVVVDFFENMATGEIVNYDPRMTAEALSFRGVKLETLTFA